MFLAGCCESIPPRSRLAACLPPTPTDANPSLPLSALQQLNQQLALKHRANIAQKQRIVAFVCSDLDEDVKALTLLAKSLKKTKISVDIVAFGTAPETNEKLEAFNKAIKGGEGSHLAIIPAGAGTLADALVTTPILAADGMMPGGGGAGGSGMMDMGDFGAGGSGGDGADPSRFEFGVDPSMDPELAMVLRMSYEEEQARQAREREGREKPSAGTAPMEAVQEEGEEESKPLLQGGGDAEASSSSAAQASPRKDKPKSPEDMDTA